MPNFFDIFFGNKSSKPIQRDIHVKLTVDADGNPIVEPIDADLFMFSPEGSTDCFKIVSDRFYHCGCNAEQPMGGRCGVNGCNRVSCKLHFQNCGFCYAPTCLEHGHWFDFEKNGQRIWLCRHCYDAAVRRRRIHTVAKGILSPFVDFKKGQNR